MKGDKVLINDLHHKKALQAFNFIQPSAKMIISIGGESGTGKTEVANVLRDLFFKINYRTKLISLDDYYITLPKEREKYRIDTDYKNVGLKEIDWKFVNSILAKFKRNQISCIFSRRINKYTDSIEHVHWHTADVDILIVEGLYGCNLDIADIKIHLEGSVEETKTFRLLRGKEKQCEYRNKVLNIESEVVKDLKSNSNFIIDFNGCIKQTGSE